MASPPRRTPAAKRKTAASNAAAPTMPAAPKPDALAETEARLGVQFPASYRAFAADRRRFRVAFKHVTLYPVQRCEWFDDRKDAVVIGITGDAYPILLTVRQSTLSEAVYEHIDGRRTRRPDFGEWVTDTREVVRPTLSDDDRARYAERLAGLARRCPCGAEIRIQQL
nr:SMI1/KNR4 family protein [Myxococcota bacterium]